MRFNRRRGLDTSRVRDQRGRGGRRGGGGVAVGGAGALIVLVIALLAGVDPSTLLQEMEGGAPQGPTGQGLEECRTGADIEEDRDCRFVAYENSVQDHWEAQLGEGWAPASFTTFTGAVRTGCGTASSQVGPFYCPADRGIYLDIGFFDTMRTQLGAQGGDFAEAYVIAHEYAHHVQHLTGQMDRVRTREGPDSDAVRLELQADCLAGVWAHHATRPSDRQEEPLITEITSEDIAVGIDAAERIGDDYIQERFQGHVTPETWTHGSSEQRQKWFTTGYRSGDLNSCDTYSAADLG